MISNFINLDEDYWFQQINQSFCHSERIQTIKEFYSNHYYCIVKILSGAQRSVNYVVKKL